MPVSVIIPVLNEAALIAGTISRSREQRPAEIIVVDGGSSDDTRRQASGADMVLDSAPGRAIQMNAGAQQARGDHLLFLHADCKLDQGALAAIERLLFGKRFVAGCLTMRVEGDGALYRCIDAVATARVRLTGIVYGDQALFVRRRIFLDLGGFPPVRFMEDVAFSRVLSRRGRMVVLSHRVHVSLRRWRKAGIVRQTVRNWSLLALAAAGVHPDRLAAFYPLVR